MGQDYLQDGKTTDVSNANSLNENEESGSASLMPPVMFSQDDDSQSASEGEEKLEGEGADRETAEDMIDDMGGDEVINPLFGANFAVRYEDALTDYYKYDDLASAAISSSMLPEDDADRMSEQVSSTKHLYGELFNTVFDACERGSASENEVEFAKDMLYEFEIRVEIIKLLYQLCALLQSTGIFAILQAIVAIYKQVGLLEIEQMLMDLDKAYKNEVKRLEGARTDFRNAKIELVLDATLASIGIGLTLFGLATPGVNVAILVAGIAGGYMLRREEESGIPSIGGVAHLKGTNIAGAKALQHFDKANVLPKSLPADVTKAIPAAEKALEGSAKSLRFPAGIGAGLSVIDVAMDARDVFDEEDQLARVVAHHKSFYNEYVIAKAELFADQIEAQKKAQVHLDNFAKAFETSEQKINELSGALSYQYQLLGNLE